jgi:hypothetical protein
MWTCLKVILCGWFQSLLSGFQQSCSVCYLVCSLPPALSSLSKWDGAHYIYIFLPETWTGCTCTLSCWACFATESSWNKATESSQNRGWTFPPIYSELKIKHWALIREFCSDSLFLLSAQSIPSLVLILGVLSSPWPVDHYRWHPNEGLDTGTPTEGCCLWWSSTENRSYIPCMVVRDIQH